jgi:hypothetical protein
MAANKSPIIRFLCRHTVLAALSLIGASGVGLTVYSIKGVEWLKPSPMYLYMIAGGTTLTGVLEWLSSEANSEEALPINAKFLQGEVDLDDQARRAAIRYIASNPNDPKLGEQVRAFSQVLQHQIKEGAMSPAQEQFVLAAQDRALLDSAKSQEPFAQAPQEPFAQPRDARPPNVVQLHERTELRPPPAGSEVTPNFFEDESPQKEKTNDVGELFEELWG